MVTAAGKKCLHLLRSRGDCGIDRHLGKTGQVTCERRIVGRVSCREEQLEPDR